MAIKSPLGRQLGTQFDSVFDVVKSNPMYHKSGGNIPSLDLNFANSKSLRDSRSTKNLINFTRASSGTYVDSDGLIKTSAVNKLLYSNEFTNAAWTQSGLTLVSSTTTAPDGTATATTFSAPNDAYILQDASSVIGQPYVNSIWIKGSVNATLGLRRPGRNNSGIGSDGTVALNVTTEWQKFTAVTTSAENTQGRLLVDFRSSTGASVPAGFEASLWHAQTEEGTTATDYIPTGATISGAPRFDHDPVTGESLGLLIEEARTNLLRHSESINQGVWVRYGTSYSADGIAAPDGQTTADKLTEDSSNSYHRVRQSISAGTTGTFSVFVKAGERSHFALGTSDSNILAVFDLNTQSVTSGSGEIYSLSNGWFRCSVYGTFTTNGVYFLIRNASTEYYQGDGNSGLYIWGAQLEANTTFPSSYIPTSGSAVTRSPDLATIEGTNFSSWYNQSEGTVFVKVLDAAYGQADSFEISNGNVNNRRTIRIDVNASKVKRTIAGAGSTSQQSSGTNYTGYPVSFKAAATDNFKFFVDGVSGSAGDANALPTNMTQLSIGFRETQSSDYLNGHISRLAYFPTRMSDQILRRLTMLGSYHPITFYLSKAEVFDDASKLTASDQTTSAHIADMNSYGIDGATVYYNLTSSSNTANHLDWVSENYFDNNIPVNIILLIKRDGYSTLSELNAGYFDYELTRFALKIAEYKQYFSLTVLHEGNGDWYPWGAGYGTNTFADLVDAYERINTILTNNAARPYVNLTANFNRRGVDGVFEQGNSYLPDIDQVIDSFSITSFNRCGTSSTYTVDTSFELEFAPAYSAISAISSKPINVGETATSGLCATSKESWYRDMLLTLYKYPAIKTINFFFGDIVTGFASNDIPVSWGFASSSEKAVFKTILEDFEELIDLS